MAFSGCTALTAVTLPSTLTMIEGDAFKGTALTAITIPAAVTTIGISAFEGCTRLATVDLSAATALTTISNNAFKGTALTDIKIPATVTQIGASAFEGCAGLTVTFADRTNSVLLIIYPDAFKGTLSAPTEIKTEAASPIIQD